MDCVWEVDQDNFAQFLLQKPLAVLYFWASWYSGDCYMKYRIKQLSRFYPVVNFGCIDVDVLGHSGMVRCLGVYHVPSVIFFCKGSKEMCAIGTTSLLALKKMVTTTLPIAEKRQQLWEQRTSQRK